MKSQRSPWKHANLCAALCFLSVFVSQIYRGLVISSSELVTSLEDAIYGNLIISLLTALVYGIFAWGATTLFRRGKHPNWYLLELMLLWFWPIIITIGLLISLEYGQQAK
ncbi:MAG: hypothetical protein CL606_05365 [Anaerolineaceae bacterium]|nr:hypothetical protein [Anaerolineaceae bacterium]|tara:strand:- start:286 stop:615 length:330 start_codon:yes stop_codon:yes gene_type:complete